MIAQPPMPEADAAVRPRPRAVRAARRQRVGHPVDQRDVGRGRRADAPRRSRTRLRSPAPHAAEPARRRARPPRARARRTASRAACRDEPPRHATARRARSARHRPRPPRSTPSGDQATARSPRPTRSTAWWWKELTSSCSLPSSPPSAAGALDAPRAWRRGRPRLAVGDRAVRDVGQVLAQRAAARHVEHLHAAADAEHRQAERLRVARSQSSKRRGRAPSARARDAARRRSPRARGRGRRRGTCRECARAARRRSDASGGSTTGSRRPARPRACRPCRAPSRGCGGSPLGAVGVLRAARTSDVVTPISGGRVTRDPGVLGRRRSARC